MGAIKNNAIEYYDKIREFSDKNSVYDKDEAIFLTIVDYVEWRLTETRRQEYGNTSNTGSEKQASTDSGEGNSSQAGEQLDFGII